MSRKLLLAFPNPRSRGWCCSELDGHLSQMSSLPNDLTKFGKLVDGLLWAVSNWPCWVHFGVSSCTSRNDKNLHWRIIFTWKFSRRRPSVLRESDAILNYQAIRHKLWAIMWGIIWAILDEHADYDGRISAAGWSRPVSRLHLSRVWAADTGHLWYHIHWHLHWLLHCHLILSNF